MISRSESTGRGVDGSMEVFDFGNAASFLSERYYRLVCDSESYGISCLLDHSSTTIRLDAIGPRSDLTQTNLVSASSPRDIPCIA
ncbi:MAG: hypothetical protein JNL67_13975 [Planctomycetaceae bacterium]|nr:hypothetical protein [Planctomycetaceae bacterium]